MNEQLLSIILTIITASTPLLLAAIGELVVERSGVLNLGVEGMMAVGAVSGFGAALMTGNPYVGVLAALVAAFALAISYLGGESAQVALGISDKTARVFQGILLFYILACDTLILYRLKFIRRPSQMAEGRA